MGLREVTGYIAHALLGAYLVWVLVSSAPQLRRGVRDRGRRLRIVLIKTAGVTVVAVAVGVIHYWATEWWHVVAAALGAAVLCLFLHRAYRKLVAPPRHRITVRQRALGRRAGHRGAHEVRHCAAEQAAEQRDQVSSDPQPRSLGTVTTPSVTGG